MEQSLILEYTNHYQVNLLGWYHSIASNMHEQARNLAKSDYDRHYNAHKLRVESVMPNKTPKDKEAINKVMKVYKADLEEIK